MELSLLNPIQKIENILRTRSFNSLIRYIIQNLLNIHYLNRKKM